MFRTNKYAIQLIREDRKISQQELANKLKINRALLSQIETGIVLPSFSMLLEISRILDCLVTDLYNKEELELMNKGVAKATPKKEK